MMHSRSYPKNFSRCSLLIHIFTLIELLVVITILAILAALLFPVLARTRAMAKMTRCRSNHKQSLMAVSLYVEDTSPDQRWLCWSRPHWGWWPRFGWAYFLFKSGYLPYLTGSENLVSCSALPGDWTSMVDGHPLGYESERKPYAYLIHHYAVNYLGLFKGDWYVAVQCPWGEPECSSPTYPHMRDRFILINRIPQPDEYILWVDSVDNGSTWGLGEANSQERLDAWMYVAIWHPGQRGVMGFADGHVIAATQQTMETYLVSGWLKFASGVPPPP